MILSIFVYSINDIDSLNSFHSINSIDSNNSIILDQVENGVAIRMAIIYLLASKMNFSIN